MKIYHKRRLVERINLRLREIKGPGAARFAAEAQKVLVDGNRRDRLEALDRRGRRMPPRKRPRADGARGAVMSPHSTRSGSIARYFARITRGWKLWGGWALTAGIKGAAYYAFHAEGKVRGAPVRDILGTTPRVHAALRKLFHAWAQGRFRR